MVMHRTQQMQGTKSDMNGEFKASKINSILLEPKVADDCGLAHMGKQTQFKLSQKVVDHTYRLYGCQLIFAKDVPTHSITDSESL